MAFNLASISRTGAPKPPRVVVFGTHGVGKTSFAASAPKPIFIRTEDGLDAVKVDAFPLAKSLDDVMAAFEALATENHEYQTVVLDSADWLENMILQQVAKDHGLDAFDSNAKALAYGRGHKAAADYWRNILQAFDYLRDQKGMGVIIIAHCQIKRFDDPTTDAYDRYQLDLNKEAASVISEWCDILGFANFRISVKEEAVGIGGKKKRGVGSGERFLFTQERPAYMAKSRWSIPDTIPLDYDSLAAELSQAMAS